MLTRYPFEYFLIHLLSIYQEKTHVRREIARHYPYVFEPWIPCIVDDDDEAGMYVREAFKSVEALNSHIRTMRKNFPVVVPKQEEVFRDRGVLTAFKQTDAVVEGYKVLGGPERRTIELCMIAKLFPETIKQVVEDVHALAVTLDAISEFGYYFFNVPLMLKSDLTAYFGYFPPQERMVYEDVLNSGTEGLCLHLDIDVDDLDLMVSMRRAYRLAYVQLMRFRTQPIEAGRYAAHWSSMLMNAHDRLKDGDDMVRRMLKVMTLFSLGEEEQAFAELDATTGELLH